MKKTLIGSIIILSATLADIGILISSAILATTLTEWNTSSRIWTALLDNGMLFPFILAKALWCIGIIILIIEYLKKNDQNHFD